jgi:hypothetical protein
VVPLNDSYVAARITELVHWDGATVPFECPLQVPVGSVQPTGEAT